MIVGWSAIDCNVFCEFKIYYLFFSFFFVNEKKYWMIMCVIYIVFVYIFLMWIMQINECNQYKNNINKLYHYNQHINKFDKYVWWLLQTDVNDVYKWPLFKPGFWTGLLTRLSSNFLRPYYVINYFGLGLL